MPEIEYLDYRVLDEYGWRWDDPSLFKQADYENFTDEVHGSFCCGWDEYILDAAEQHGHDWPYRCRAGACTDCAAMVVEGELDMDVQVILADEEVREQNLRLACISTPRSSTVKILINARVIQTLQNRVVGNYDSDGLDSRPGSSSCTGSSTKVYSESDDFTKMHDGDGTEIYDGESTTRLPTNFCSECGQDLSVLEQPRFCPNCGFEMS